ncbi:MAG: sugar-binding protein [Candidatus Margulisiibacteriota bacterium]
MKKFLVSIIILAVIGVAAVAFAIKVNKGSEDQGVYFGLFREGAPRNMGLIKNFEKTYNFRPHIIMWYLDWNQKFPLADCMKILEYGAIPQIVWEPWIWGDFNAIKLNNIINGEWDDYITTWAKDIKRFQYPIFIRFAHEFNIDGYPWSLIHNDKDPNRYIKAFRHVVDIFRKEGAYNALFIWCPMNYSYPNEPWNDFMKAYPGDDYVDWIGLDGYNWGVSQTWSQWQTFEDLFKEPLRKFALKIPDKPIMIGEFSSTPLGGDKAQWILDIPSYLKTTLKPIKAILWFDIKKEADWRICGPPNAAEAFKVMIQDPIFKKVKLDNITNLEVNNSIEFTKRNFVFSYTATPKIIDGTFIDWDNKLFANLDTINFVSAGGNNWHGPVDLSARVSFAWDENFLYAVFDVTDDIPYNNKKVEGNIWDGDAVEICMSVNPKDNPARTSYSKTDFQIGFSTGDYLKIPPQTWVWQKGKPLANSEFKVKPKVNSKNIIVGYIAEIKIPWASLGNYQPSKGDRLGFTFAIDDSDKSDHREKQMLFAGDFMFFKDPSVWGTATLK